MTEGPMKSAEIRLVPLTHCDPMACIEWRPQDYNIGTATKFFNGLLKSNDGNVLLSLGMYNGWFRGMTHVSLPLFIVAMFCKLMAV